mmetsp:Transcript_4674/g.13473  ORF Transcript_4674/g.13473 Transcript_4674/m.13473 type:complete len:229 (-) Transcript_4674:1225-1911(-)
MHRLSTTQRSNVWIVVKAYDAEPLCGRFFPSQSNQTRLAFRRCHERFLFNKPAQFGCRASNATQKVSDKRSESTRGLQYSCHVVVVNASPRYKKEVLSRGFNRGVVLQFLAATRIQDDAKGQTGPPETPIQQNSCKSLIPSFEWKKVQYAHHRGSGKSCNPHRVGRVFPDVWQPVVFQGSAQCSDAFRHCFGPERPGFLLQAISQEPSMPTQQQFRRERLVLAPHRIF